jgi:hypothetical protein
MFQEHIETFAGHIACKQLVILSLLISTLRESISTNSALAAVEYIPTKSRFMFLYSGMYFLYLTLFIFIMFQDSFETFAGHMACTQETDRQY